MRPIPSILTAIALGSSVGLTGCGTTLDDATGVLVAMRSTSGLGGVAVSLTRQSRTVQALPANTASVKITVSGHGLRAPLSKTITEEQFINNTAMLNIDKLPPGEVQLDAVVYDDQGNSISMGGAKATIRVGETTQVALNLITRGATGNAVVTVDSKVVYDDPILAVPIPPVSPKTLSISPVNDSTCTPGWTSTMRVERGQILKLTVTDRIAYRGGSDFVYNYYDPTGFSSYAFTGQLDATLPVLALVGKFISDDGDVVRFAIGKTGSFKAPGGGKLYLGANTWVKSSHVSYFSGSFSVAIADGR